MNENEKSVHFSTFDFHLIIDGSLYGELFPYYLNLHSSASNVIRMTCDCCEKFGK